MHSKWIMSSLLAIRLSKDDHNEKDAMAELQRALAELTADARETAFWKEDAFLADLHQSKDAWHRVFDLSRYGGIQLNDEKDAAWVRKRLSKPDEPLEHREMMLWSEMLLLNSNTTKHRELLEGLKPLVSDAPKANFASDVGCSSATEQTNFNLNGRCERTEIP